jgi:hypothetical protein
MRHPGRMARFYFHLRTAAGVELTDDDGDDLPDRDAAEQHAIRSAEDLLKASTLDWGDASFEVYDETDRHVVTVWFKEVGNPDGAVHRSPPDDRHA